MIPIRDDAPRFTTPFVTYFVLGINVLVFLFELTLSAQQRLLFVYQFGFVPSSLSGSLGGSPEASFANSVATIFTSMFLHGGWLHLIFNMWVLWIFGDNLEDHLGHFRYLLFYLMCGLAASGLHFLFNQSSDVPSVGASGAIAGVMGGYFVLFPAARVLTVVPIVFYVSFFWLPAWLVLGFWFIGQFLSGAADSIVHAGQQPTGGVAFWAHVGGFAAGAVLIKLFPAAPRRAKYGMWA